MVDWLNISATSGSGDATITITATSHTELTRRLAAIKFKNTEHNLTAQTSVVQDAYVPEPIHVVVNPTSIDNIPQSGGSYEICVQSNGDWTVQVPSWATSTIASGSGNQCFTVTVDENDKESMNIGDIVISSVDETKYVPLIQEGVTPPEPTYLRVNPTTITNIPASGKTYQLCVESNGNWEVRVPASGWILSSISSGTGDQCFNITVGENTEETQQSGEVAIYNATDIVYVSLTQKGVTPPEPSYLRVSPTSINDIPSYGGMYQLCVESNSNWTVQTPTWVTSTVVSGSGDQCFNIVVDENEEESTNIGDIVISSEEYTVTVSLIQEGATPTPPGPIPTGEYITFEVLGNDSNMEIENTDSLGNHSIEYKVNNNSWNSVIYFTQPTTLSLNAGDKVYVRGSGDNGFGTDIVACRFKITGNVKVYGNIMSIADYTHDITAFTECCFERLFSDCTGLTDASGLILPATTLTKGCYKNMFNGCSSLVSAPELPATTLVNGCYESMFNSCTSLITAPELPATTLVGTCYNQMFWGCSRLSYIKIAATELGSGLSLWVGGVSPTGTFVKKAGVNYPTGMSGIPSGWTVIEE